MKKNTRSTILLYIIGIITAIIYLSPFYILVINSFKTKQEIFASTLSFPTTFTLENFRLAIEKLSFFWVGNEFTVRGIFGSSLFNSLSITTISILLLVIIQFYDCLDAGKNKN